MGDFHHDISIKKLASRFVHTIFTGYFSTSTLFTEPGEEGFFKIREGNAGPRERVTKAEKTLSPRQRVVRHCDSGRNPGPGPPEPARIREGPGIPTGHPVSS
jgi:hypothetical protein